jgi:hypothetical protein
VDVDKKERSCLLTQPVQLQSFEDEFDPPEGAFPRTPAITGDILLLRGEIKDQILCKEQKTHQFGTGKLLHVMRWSRPETLISVLELSRFVQGAVSTHAKVML